MALVRIAFRRDTASTWTATNPVLASGEPGVETDTGKLKVGDGTRNWNTLPYASGTSLASSAPPAAGVSSAAGVSELAARSDHTHAMPLAILATTVNTTGAIVAGGDLTVVGRLNGGSHTHTTNDLSDWSAKFASTLKSSLASGTNMTLSYGTNNVITLASTASGGSGVGAVSSVNGLTGVVVIDAVTAPQLESRLGRLVATTPDVLASYDATTGVSLLIPTLDGGTFSGVSLTVPLAISSQPVSVTASGGTAVFTIVTSGGIGEVSYQWQETANFPVSWADIALATTDTLTLTGLTDAKNGYDYRCIVSSAGGEGLNSASANLTVAGTSGTVLTITTQPESTLTKEPNEPYTLTILATAGSTAVVYHWELFTDGAWYGVGTNTTSYTDFAPVLDGGSEQMRCRVTAGGATAYSTITTINAVLTAGNFQIHIQPQSFAGCTVSLSMQYSYVGHLDHLLVWQTRMTDTGAWQTQAIGATGMDAVTTEPSSGLFQSVLTIAVFPAVWNGRQWRAVIKTGVLNFYSDVAIGTTQRSVVTEQPAPTTTRLPSGPFALQFQYNAGCYTPSVAWEYRQPPSTAWLPISGQSSTLLDIPQGTSFESRDYRAAIRQTGDATVVYTAVATVTSMVSGGGSGATLEGFFDIQPAALTTLQSTGSTALHARLAAGSGEIVHYWWQFSSDNGATWQYTSVATELDEGSDPTQGRTQNQNYAINQSNYYPTGGIQFPKKLIPASYNNRLYRCGARLKSIDNNTPIHYSDTAKLVVSGGPPADGVTGIEVMDPYKPASVAASNGAGNIVVILWESGQHNGYTYSGNSGTGPAEEVPTQAAKYSLDNGVTYRIASLPKAAAWNCLRYGDGVFMACSIEGDVAQSMDGGVTWTMTRTGPTRTYAGTYGTPTAGQTLYNYYGIASLHFTQAAPAGSRWLLIAPVATTDKRTYAIFASGQTSALTQQAWLERGRFVEALYDAAPMLGEAHKATADGPGVAYGNGLYVVQAGITCCRSSNGGAIGTWSTATVAADTATKNYFFDAVQSSLAFAGGRFVRTSMHYRKSVEDRAMPMGPMGYPQKVTRESTAYYTDEYQRLHFSGEFMSFWSVDGLNWQPGQKLRNGTRDGTHFIPDLLEAYGDTIVSATGGIYAQAPTASLATRGPSLKVAWSGIATLTPADDPYKWEIVLPDASEGGLAAPVPPRTRSLKTGMNQVGMIFNTGANTATSHCILLRTTVDLPGSEPAVPLATPTAVLGLGSVYDAVAQEVTVIWTPPANADATEVAHYRLHTGPTIAYGNVVVLEANITKQVVANAAQIVGDTFYYRVRAVGSSGLVGPWVEQALVLRALPPGPPTALTKTSQPSWSTVVIGFSAPAANGGATITSYELGCTRSGVDYVLPVSTPAGATNYIGSAVFSGLSVTSVTSGGTALAPNIYRIRAVNSAGRGAWSADLAVPIISQTIPNTIATPSPVAPAVTSILATAPLNFRVTSAVVSGTGQVVLEWNPPTSHPGGTGISSYVVQAWSPRWASQLAWHSLPYAAGYSMSTQWTCTIGIGGSGNGSATIGLDQSRVGLLILFRVYAVTSSGNGLITASQTATLH